MPGKSNGQHENHGNGGQNSNREQRGGGMGNFKQQGRQEGSGNQGDFQQHGRQDGPANVNEPQQQNQQQPLNNGGLRNLIRANRQQNRGAGGLGQGAAKNGCLPKLFMLALPFIALGTFLLLRS